MGTAFTQQPTIGEGIFTPSEIAKFLKLPTSKVNRWVNSYWDGEFASRTGHGQSWKRNNSKAVNFLTMVELLIMASLSEQGAETALASRYWPMGKDNSVVVDPERKFGHPVINETNIYPETIYGMVQAGDPPGFIANLYSLTVKEVEDAIAYCSAA
jgi:uncharacterized protein (DUF433 family)